MASQNRRTTKRKTSRAAFPRWITARKLAQLLHVKPHTVLRWIHSGELPAFNIASGRVARYRIYKGELRVFLRKRGMSHRQLVTLGLEPEG
jgi:excisionase family DNA binding protein